MQQIWIPLELIHPKKEKKTVVYGAHVAREFVMELNLPISLSSADYNYAFGRSVAEGYPRYDPAELIGEREKLYQKTLIEVQSKIRETMDPAPAVHVHILHNNHAEQYSARSELPVLIFSESDNGE